MKRLLSSPSRVTPLIMLFIAVISLSQLAGGGYGQIAHLKVESSETTLKAGFDNNVTITVYNDFEPIYELDVTISFPASMQLLSSPQILGLNHWKFNKLNKGDQVKLSITIFAPDEAAGNAYTASLILIYKRLGYISPYTETHALGFYAKGWIQMTIYDLSVDPSPSHPGEPVSFTASLLNRGNIPAMFTNVTLIGDGALIHKPESFSYLGQVDPNSPAPFTLEALVRPGLEEGNYTAAITVSYEDKEHIVHQVVEKVPFQVVKPVEEKPQPPRIPVLGYLEQVKSYLPQDNMLIIIAVVLIVILGGVAAARRRRPREEEEPL
ncbi:MAG: hypothetical protein QXE79_07360 [Candidatus Bathyarchaeia archaeon]